MSEACTILAPLADGDAVLLTCVPVFGWEALQVEGTPPEWQRITVRCPSSTLVIHSMEPDQPGQRFEQMIRGTQRYFAQVKTDAVVTRDWLVEWLGSVSYAVGVVAEPSFVEEEQHWTFILGVAQRLRGVVLYQNSICNSDGALILDVDGNWDAGAFERLAI
jgi:hypothetical protein